jgi:hypothetical protein
MRSKPSPGKPVKTNVFLEIKCFCLPELYKKIIKAWHKRRPERRAPVEIHNPLLNRIVSDCYYNFMLWHAEDEARRKDVNARIIAGLKHAIDRHNQNRNDCIEKIDALIMQKLLVQTGYIPGKRQNSETPGSIMDRICILSLKIYHMKEEAVRKNAGKEHNRKSRIKLGILNRQQTELYQCLLELLEDYIRGRKSLKLFHQFKMYNDPSLNPSLYKRTEYIR